MFLETIAQKFSHCSIRECVIQGNRNIEITDVTADSRTVKPGALFIARKGGAFDGNTFIADAVSSGAVCVASEKYDPAFSVTQLIVPDVSLFEPELADFFWGSPSKELYAVGVTGTSGKTTVSYLIYQLFSYFSYFPGLVGTVAYVSGKKERKASRTTPDACVLQKLLREQVDFGAKASVMEVSSHALIQRRVAFVDFNAAIFTNLTHEHLDYHKTMASYAEAKSKLFTSLSSEAICIVNVNDSWSDRITGKSRAKRWTYALEGQADLAAYGCRVEGGNTCFSMVCRGEKAEVLLPLIGLFNVENALAAASLFLARGYSLGEVAKGLVTVKAPPGRLQRVEGVKRAIYIDYAHKENALRHVLSTVRAITSGKIITVFGCGGERDMEKRPLMARAAEELSDTVVVTSDNPRGEDPQSIIRDICVGFQNISPIIEPDRKRAIAQAVQIAREEDTILIAGKGHEKEQIVNGTTLAFDDYQVAEESCRSLG